LRRKGGGFGEACDPPITTESKTQRRVSAVATCSRLTDDGTPELPRVTALSSPRDISGLIAWTRRDEWRGALAERIERHAAKACAGAGIAEANIESVLGDYGVSSLWGAAFEDLLATDLPDGRNLAE
jgi:hypothetical protein